MGSRPITAALLAALSAVRVRPLLLVEAFFDSGTLRMWNGLGPLAVLGNQWIGVGLMQSISQIDETSEVRAAGAQIGLSGIPSSMLSVILQEDYQGRKAHIYVGAFDLATDAIIVDPLLMFSGSIDTMPVLEGGETASVFASVESRLIRLEGASRRRFTAADQRFRFPDDAGLDHVAAIQDVQIVWGAASPFDPPSDKTPDILPDTGGK